ncbi:MAG: MFS transporter [Acutalibacteraceae bacterium]
MSDPNFTKRRRLGYAVGISTESILYNMFYTYYLFFLTDIAHLDPGLAGTVNLISVAWDAITDPIIGRFADRNGQDKRKLMFRAALPVGITFIGAFLPVNFENQAFKFIFYVAMTMLFWLAYTVYTIPYYAVVAEITQDYDERTAIRAQSSLFNTVCIFVGNAVPSVLPGLFAGIGITLALGWTLTAAVLGVIAIITGMIAAYSLRSVTLKKAEATAESQEKVSFKDYLQILRIKPFRWFVMFVFFFLVATSMIQTNFAYLVQGRLGMSDDDMVIVIVTLVLAMAVVIPIVTKVAEKTDRRFTSLCFTAVMMVCLVIIKFIGIYSVVMLIASVFAVAIGLGCFWTVFYSMAYDLVEVDEFVNGKRRESMITAFPQFFQKFGAAIGMWIAGQVLKFGGYDGTLAVQAQSAKDAIENIATVIPAFFLLFAMVGLFMYPVTKKSFRTLQEKLELKRAGKETDNTGIEKLV